jgi:hypothetical protein
MEEEVLGREEGSTQEALQKLMQLKKLSTVLEPQGQKRKVVGAAPVAATRTSARVTSTAEEARGKG